MMMEDCWNKSEDVVVAAVAAAAVADDVKVKVTEGNEMHYWYWYWYWWWGRRMLNVGHSCFLGMPWIPYLTLPTFTHLTP